MSLLDTFLLDPLPLDVWITPRTDGVQGSGTEDDPYDGSVRAKPVNPVHNVTYGTFQQATAAQDIVACNNWFKNVNKGVLVGGTGHRRFSRHESGGARWASSLSTKRTASREPLARRSGATPFGNRLVSIYRLISKRQPAPSGSINLLMQW